MKTIIETINVYTFDELSEDAQEKALNDLCDINTDYGWWEFVYYDAEEVGLKLTAFDIDNYCKGDFIQHPLEVAQNILNFYGDSCNIYRTASDFLEEHAPIFSDYLNENSENYESEELEKQLKELEDEFLNSLLEDYRITLKKEYFYLTSEEAIIETIRINNYAFTEDGTLYN